MPRHLPSRGTPGHFTPLAFEYTKTRDDLILLDIISPESHHGAAHALPSSGTLTLGVSDMRRQLLMTDFISISEVDLSS